jgi:hypothetical protein
MLHTSTGRELVYPATVAERWSSGGVDTRIFEIGEKRSGTNVLRLLLHAHSRIVAPHSPHLLQRFTPVLESFGDLSDERNFRRLIEYACAFTERDPIPWTTMSQDHARTQNFELDRDKIYERSSERSLVAVHRAMLDLYAEAEGATAWVDKSGQSVRFARQLEEHYHWHGEGLPRYIWLHRHPVDVALSSMKAPIGAKTAFVAARQWAKLNRLCRELQARFPERVYKLGFEQLVHNPEQEARAICEFLDLEYEPEMLCAHRGSDAKRAASRSALWQNLTQAINPAQAMKFLPRFHDADPLVVEAVEVVERVAHEEMLHAGYELLTDSAGLGRYEEEQVRKFEEEDHRLQHEAFQRLSPDEQQMRSQQYRLLDEIQDLSSEE